MRSRSLAVVFTAALSSSTLSCGLGMVEDPSGGAEHLPTQGAGPYGKLDLDFETPADEPYVVSSFPASVRDPSPLWREDGGIRLWFGHEADQTGQESAIWYAELPALTELADVPPRPALVADQPWEQGWAGAPSVIEQPGGELVMFYQGGRDAPAIGRADSYDGGETWNKHEANPVVADAGKPGVAFVTEVGWLLYATRAGQEGIYRAESADGVRWSWYDQPVLVPRWDMDTAYDRHRVSDPWVVVRTTAAGRLHYGLFFNGMDGAGEDASESVGWAGSFDGIHWRRFDRPDEPVLAPGGTSEHGPGVLVEPERGVMFFSELRRGVQSIAAAVHP